MSSAETRLSTASNHVRAQVATGVSRARRRHSTWRWHGRRLPHLGLPGWGSTPRLHLESASSHASSHRRCLGAQHRRGWGSFGLLRGRGRGRRLHREGAERPRHRAGTPGGWLGRRSRRVGHQRRCSAARGDVCLNAASLLLQRMS